MPIEVSRRLLLIGGASFVATAAVPLRPLLLDTPAPVISSATLSDRFPYRKIFDMLISFEPTREELAHSEFVAISLFRSGESISFHRVGMSLRGMYRWLAMEGDEIEVTPQSGLSIIVDPAIKGANVDLTYNVEPDPDKRARLFLEQFRFAGAGALVGGDPMALNPESDLPP